MGTSTRWQGPRGNAWALAANHVRRWRPTRHRAEERLAELAAEHLAALHMAVRCDRSAFGLYDRAVAAGDRLCTSLGSLHARAPRSTEALLGELVAHVDGDGGTLTDAAIRRAVGTAVRGTAQRHPEWDAALAREDNENGLPWDLLCTLYRLFFAAVVAEFLRAVVAEHVSFTLPVMVDVDAEGRVVDWITEKLVKLVPDPCEEAARPDRPEDVVDTTAREGDSGQDQLLPGVAASLVPLAVSSVLGLVGGGASEERRGGAA